MEDRKKYWNEKYTEYWKMVTTEANDKDGDKTKIVKTTSGDYKTVGEDTSYIIFNEMDYLSQEKLLDYGCGFGRFFDFFNIRSDYYGIDISESMISECIKEHPESAKKFLVSEGEDLPWKDCFFDKIICYGVFDACYQEAALYEMLRVLKVGGCILLTGKNCFYHNDDEQAYIAEEAARRKGHPNYFTDVNSMLEQIKEYVNVEKKRFYVYRGDFCKNIFLEEMPEKFYEYVLILKKEKSLPKKLVEFSNKYSKTWMNKNRDTD